MSLESRRLSDRRWPAEIRWSKGEKSILGKGGGWGGILEGKLKLYGFHLTETVWKYRREKFHLEERGSSGGGYEACVQREELQKEYMTRWKKERREQIGKEERKGMKKTVLNGTEKPISRKTNDGRVKYIGSGGCRSPSGSCGGQSRGLSRKVRGTGVKEKKEGGGKENYGEGRKNGYGERGREEKSDSIVNKGRSMSARGEKCGRIGVVKNASGEEEGESTKFSLREGSKEDGRR